MDDRTEQQPALPEKGIEYRSPFGFTDPATAMLWFTALPLGLMVLAALGQILSRPAVGSLFLLFVLFQGLWLPYRHTRPSRFEQGRQPLGNFYLNGFNTYWNTPARLVVYADCLEIRFFFDTLILYFAHMPGPPREVGTLFKSIAVDLSTTGRTKTFTLYFGPARRREILVLLQSVALAATHQSPTHKER